MTASKSGTLPESISRIISSIVNDIYVIYSIFAESLILTVIFLSTGPGVSALAIICPFIPSAGSMEMTKRSIPMPPSQFDIAFHSSSPPERNFPATTEQPVVVNPDVDSNRASI